MIQVEIIPEYRRSPIRGPALCSECQEPVSVTYWICPVCGSRLCVACASAGRRHHYPTSMTGGDPRICPGRLPAVDST